MVTQRQYDCFEKIQAYLATQEFARNITDISKHTNISRPTVDDILKKGDFVSKFEAMPGNSYRNRVPDEPAVLRPPNPVETIIAASPASKPASKVAIREGAYETYPLKAIDWEKPEHVWLAYNLIRLVKPKFLGLKNINDKFNPNVDDPTDVGYKSALTVVVDEWNTVLESVSHEHLKLIKLLQGAVATIRKAAEDNDN